MAFRKKGAFAGSLVLALLVIILFYLFRDNRKVTYETFFPFRLYNHQYIYQGAVKQLTTRAYRVRSDQDSLLYGNLRYTYITTFDRKLGEYTEFSVIVDRDTSVVQAEYDTKGRLQRVVFEDSSVSLASYDANGYLNQVADRDKEGQLTRRESFQVQQQQYIAKTSHDLRKNIDRRSEYTWYPDGLLQSVKVYILIEEKRQLEEELAFTYDDKHRTHYQRKRYTGTGALEESEETWLYNGFTERSTIVTWGDTSHFVNRFELDRRGNPLKTMYYLNGEAYQVDVFEYTY
ncbi:MAG: hypothetical protein R2824_30870 [Saprospiraceae bacterium]|nr:hypothetical protein [Lewinella sp.]